MRCCHDSIPPLRLEILLDVADHPRTSAGEIRKRIRKPWRTVKRQLDALAMLGVLIIDEDTETTTTTAPDGTEKTKKTTVEVYDLNPDFDRDALAEIAAAKPATRAEAEM